MPDRTMSVFAGRLRPAPETASG